MINPFAPPIPSHFGPARRAALSKAQRGWCAVCDEQPIPSSTDRQGRAQGRRYTCRRPACVAAWGRLCQRDYRHARRQRVPPSGMVHRVTGAA